MKKSNELNISNEKNRFRTTLSKKLVASLSGLFLAFAFSSCEQLQDSLSSEQLADQKDGIGALSAPSTTCYYNGLADANVKGTESHLVLNLSQLADATSASVKYELSYSMNGVAYTSSGSANGTLSASKSKYYVDLSPAINLLDGTQSPAYDDISYTVTVSGIKNASGNDYDGRSMPTFTKKISFAPLYSGEEIEFSTKSAIAGTEFSIPLNGKISAVDETVELTATSGSLPSTTFTASVSSDGKSIVIKTSEDISDSEFTASIKCTGIKVNGIKESYEHEFTGVKFEIGLPSKEFSATELNGTPKRVINADDVKELDIQKITFSCTNSPSWVTGVVTAGDATDDWGDKDACTQIENLTNVNKTIVAGSDWSNAVIANIKENGLKIAGGGTFAITIKLFYSE